MSDLSRLRARWIRLENRIKKFDAEIEAAEDFEVAELIEKQLVAKEKLELTIAQTNAEEKRIMADPAAKLRYTGV